MTVLSLYSVLVNVINVNYMLRVHRIFLFSKNLNIEAFSSIFQVLLELQPLYYMLDSLYFVFISVRLVVRLAFALSKFHVLPTLFLGISFSVLLPVISCLCSWK